MHHEMDVLSDKKETVKSFRVFLESKEAENGIDLKTARVLLAEFQELLVLSQGFYKSALENIAKKRVVESRLEFTESRLELLESISRDYHFNIEIITELGSRKVRKMKYNDFYMILWRSNEKGGS